MALRLYHDSDATTLIDDTNPDEVREAVVVGNDLEDIQQIYLASDDTNLTYENIEITAVNTDAQVTVEYAFDSSGSPGTWQTTLQPANGAYTTSEIIWRRVFSGNVTEAFTRTDIDHRVTADEYVA